VCLQVQVARITHTCITYYTRPVHLLPSKYLVLVTCTTECGHTVRDKSDNINLQNHQASPMMCRQWNYCNSNDNLIAYRNIWSIWAAAWLLLQADFVAIFF
jgi:hypothetical protein